MSSLSAERSLASCCTQVEQELTELGLSREAMDGIVAATRIGDLKELQQLLGDDNAASQELQELFSIAEGYGIAEYLQLDTSCVRGLAYYTGEFGSHASQAASLSMVSCKTLRTPCGQS